RQRANRHDRRDHRRDEDRPKGRRVPRPGLIAAVVTAIVAIGALTASRWFFAPPAAPTGTGTLSVNTNPPGAQVLIDGVSRGVTPLTVPLNVGVHAMQLRG